MRPLKDIRILDFFWLGAGPVGSLALGHLGAEVIRIESQARLDKLREGGPYPADPDVDMAGVFASINFGKKSVTLNLSNPAAREVVYALTARCDVVTNNFKASTLARFGLSFEDLVAHNPRLVYVSMSTMGADGPCNSYGAYGSHLSAMAGINGVTGRDGEIPVGLGPLVPDFSCNPFHAALAILGGLRCARLTGWPVNIDISQIESTIHLLGPLVKQASLTSKQPSRVGTRHSWRAPHGLYRCDGDDEWVAISVGSDRQWDSVVELVAREQPGPWTAYDTFLLRQRHRDEIDQAISAWCAAREKWQATAELVKAGVPAWPVNNLQDQIEVDPVLREEFVRVPLADKVQATVQRMPIAFAGELAPLSPPRLGEHTYDVLHGLLGYSEGRIADLITAGAVE